MRKTESVDITAVILAAGKGVRMNSHLPKVLISIAGKPMIKHIVDKVKKLSPREIVIVANNENLELLKKRLKNDSLLFVIQEIPLGTADAVMRAKDFIHTSKVLVLCGDVPAIRKETLKRLIEYHEKENASCTILTAVMDDPSGYGRIVRNGEGYVDRIVEEKDANEEEKSIKEINSGIYVFDRNALFKYLPKVKPSMVTGEYYLTGLIHIFKEKNKKICAYPSKNWMEVSGVNTKEELERMRRYLSRRKR